MQSLHYVTTPRSLMPQGFVPTALCFSLLTVDPFSSPRSAFFTTHTRFSQLDLGSPYLTTRLACYVLSLRLWDYVLGANRIACLFWCRKSNAAARSWHDPVQLKKIGLHEIRRQDNCGCGDVNAPHVRQVWRRELMTCHHGENSQRQS
jgi:hypothetical protein